jgi:hypothetical protein
VERSPAPTLKEFSGDFMKQIRMVCASKPRTIQFYQEKLKRLLAHGKLADSPLDRIDEDMIEAYKRARSVTESRRQPSARSGLPSAPRTTLPPPSDREERQFIEGFSPYDVALRRLIGYLKISRSAVTRNI